MVARILLITLAFCAAAPAYAADWLRAESEHYVVHAEMEEEDLIELVQLMEDFDRLLTELLPPQTTRGRKVQFYLESSPRRIYRISGVRNEGLDVDLPEIAASFATYDRSRNRVHWYRSIFSDQASFYIRNAFWRPSPVWAEDGFGGFFATAYISDDGAFVLGAPEVLSPLQGSASVPGLLRMMTTGRAPEGIRDNRRFRQLNRQTMTALIMQDGNTGALQRYLAAYASGISMEEATRELGDLEELTRSINEQASGRKVDFRQVRPSEAPPAEVRIRAMGEDEIALIVPRFERLYGDNPGKSANKLKRLTERYPTSARTWYEYAAAEFARVRDAEFGGETVFRGFGFSNGELVVSANPYSDAIAWRAVNRALDLDPGNVPATRLRAEIQLSRLVRAGDVADAERYENVRATLRPLAADPASRPLAAALLFQSYIEEGNEPPDEVLDLLGQAFVANAGVEEFRYAYAVALSRRGQRDVAETLLTSMLNHPEYRDAAQRALEATRF